MNTTEVKECIRKAAKYSRNMGKADYRGNVCFTSKRDFKEHFGTDKMIMLLSNKMVVKCEVRISAIFGSDVLKDQHIILANVMESTKIPEDVYDRLFVGLDGLKLKVAIVDVYAIKGDKTAFIESWCFVMD